MTEDGVIQFRVPGDIVPWARAGSNNGMRFTPKRQGDYMATLKSLAEKAMSGKAPIDGPCELKILAVYPWPKGISPKKRGDARNALKISRPDIDNVGKIVKDAIQSVVFTDDARVCDELLYKRYGDIPSLEVRVRAL